MVSLSRGPWRPSRIPHVHQYNPTVKCAINNGILLCYKNKNDTFKCFIENEPAESLISSF